MSKDLKVSIIIPVYNVEQYLPKCLDSVINQTLKDIEIICINDGSTDNSLSILKEYASKEMTVFCVISFVAYECDSYVRTK
jgi:glycosyltransferase involved in cell wall biosynthesis